MSVIDLQINLVVDNIDLSIRTPENSFTGQVNTLTRSDNTIDSITLGEPVGSDRVLNVVSLTQAEYNSGVKKATTLYIIN